MRSSGQYSEEEIEAAVADVVVYQQSHQDRPGFFDTAINTGPSIGQTIHSNNDCIIVGASQPI